MTTSHSALPGASVVRAAAASLDETLVEYLSTLSALYGFNGTDLVRLLAAIPADALATPATALLDVVSRLQGYNGASWDMVRSEGNDRDAIAVQTLGNLQTIQFPHLFNGTTWDRARAAGAASPGLGSQLVTPVLNPTIQQDVTLNDSNKTFTVPASTQWKILWIYIEYTATATVGTRTLAAQIRDSGDDVIYDVRSGLTITLGQARSFVWMPGVTRESAYVDGMAVVSLPTDLWLPAGYDIRINDRGAIDLAADDMIVHMMVDERAV